MDYISMQLTDTSLSLIWWIGSNLIDWLIDWLIDFATSLTVGLLEVAYSTKMEENEKSVNKTEVKQGGRIGRGGTVFLHIVTCELF